MRHQLYAYCGGERLPSSHIVVQTLTRFSTCGPAHRYRQATAAIIQDISLPSVEVVFSVPRKANALMALIEAPCQLRAPHTSTWLCYVAKAPASWSPLQGRGDGPQHGLVIYMHDRCKI